jgi:CBS domain-containing protein
VIDDCAPEKLHSSLRSHPYQRFPVLQNGRLAGILTRKEAERALEAKRPVKLEPAVTCLRRDTVRDLQSKLIESTSLIAVMLDHPDGQVLAVITLHDLLRAEVSLTAESTK